MSSAHMTGKSCDADPRESTALRIPAVVVEPNKA